jgi:hypothetical protein
MITSIGINHKAQLARSQHVMEWLQQERGRVQAEAAILERQWQQEELKLRAFLANSYHITGPFTLDTDKGTIETPDPEPEKVDVKPQPAQ